MPNLCDFVGKVVASKKEDITTLFSYYTTDYSYEKDSEGKYHCNCPAGRHFWRTFDFCGGEDIKEENGKFSTYFDGDCAWSVYSCMFSGPYTYQTDNSDCSCGIDLEEATKTLGLEVEIYSNECGMEFAEHYIVKNGVTEVNEEVDYSEEYYEDYDDYKENGDGALTEDEFYDTDCKIVHCEWDFDNLEYHI